MSPRNTNRSGERNGDEGRFRDLVVLSSGTARRGSGERKEFFRWGEVQPTTCDLGPAKTETRDWSFEP